MNKESQHGDFEKFHKINGPAVSIKKDGTITLRKSIVEVSEIYPSTPPPNAFLHYAEELNQIGIEPKETTEDTAVDLRRVNPEADTFILSAKSFLDAMNISYSETTKYPAEWNEERGMIIVELNEGLTVKQG